jgi:hypothetical protein
VATYHICIISCLEGASDVEEVVWLVVVGWCTDLAGAEVR